MQRIFTRLFLLTGVLLSAPLYSQTEVDKLTASDALANDGFGLAVVEGNFAYIGASRADKSGTADTGAVYVFQDNGSSWVEIQKVTASDSAALDEFGGAIDVDGDFMVVGAAEHNLTMFGDEGAAYFFECVNGVWVERQKVVASNPTSGAQFGSGVAISGTTAIIGAEKGDATPGGEEGIAYVFDYDGSTWSQVQTLVSSDGERLDDFGRRVTMEETRAVISALHWDDPLSGTDSNEGAAYVFDYNGSSWVQSVRLDPVNFPVNGEENFAPGGAHLGTGISLDGDTLVTGGFQEDFQSLRDAGAIWIWDYDGQSWGLTQKMFAGDPQFEARFGGSVSVEGDMILAGSSQADGGGFSDDGAFYVIEKQGSTWVETNMLRASDPADSLFFGAGVMLAGNKALIGSAADVGGQTAAGAVYVFEFETSTDGEILPYGCSVNPAGSLVHVLGVLPNIGATVTLAVDDPMGTMPLGSLPVITFSEAPHPKFPCGAVLPTFGMSGPGELLIDITQTSTQFPPVVGAPWSGSPVEVGFAIPNDPSLVGESIYAQGYLKGFVQGGNVSQILIGLADAVELVIGM